MPEVILPCPACGSDVKISGGDEWHNQHSFFIECQCGVCRVGDTVRETCIERWNDLPRYRPLTWTNEPPRVAGWYPWRSGKGQNMTMIQIHIFNGVCGFWDGNGVFITDLNRGEWAGPIPPPID